MLAPHTLRCNRGQAHHIDAFTPAPYALGLAGMSVAVTKSPLVAIRGGDFSRPKLGTFTRPLTQVHTRASGTPGGNRTHTTNHRD